MIILSERLKLLRNEQRLTQQNLADLLGVKLRTYQYYESGNDKSHRPDLETLVVMADFYGVTIDYLVGRSDERGKK